MSSCGYPIPRPEYPRPDFQRGRMEGNDWLNLNGIWQFRFDPNREGEPQGWQGREESFWRDQIIVPFCWESLAAWGEADAAGNDNYFSRRIFKNPGSVTVDNYRSAPRYEVGWYRRVITVPRSGMWADKRAILTVGAADYFTDAWCNGIHLGHHEGGYLPFEFDLTDALQPGVEGFYAPAVFVLRVEDPMNNREQPVGKQWGWYTSTSGVWQTIYLEPRAKTFIKSCRFFPDIDLETVTVSLQLAGAAAEVEAEMELQPPSGDAVTIRLTKKAECASSVVNLRPAVLWDTRDPKLYQTVLRLKNAQGQVMDEVRSYFGMRKISTGSGPDATSPGWLCLNNQPIYLRGALYQSYHPDGVYTAGDAATLRRDLSFAREAGFDFLRVHIKLDDPLLLYYADVTGMLLMQDFPNFGEGGDTPLGRTRFEEMMRRGIERDFNHPSIISWCLFNETWGFGGQTELMKWITPHAEGKEEKTGEATAKIANLSSFKWIHQMWLLAKTLDNSRLIEDMSVVIWEHLAAYGHVDTDINSWHFYLNDYAKAKSHITHVVEQTFPGSKFNYVEGFSQRRAPLINSEYGGVGALDGDRDVSWSFKFLTNELRLHPQLSAYIYTELTDVEWEHNGFLNYDRTPKQFGYDPTLVNQGDVLPIDAPPIARHAPGETVAVPVYSSHYSRRAYADVELSWNYSGIDTLGELHGPLQEGKLKIPFAAHQVQLAQSVQLVLPATPMLCTLSVCARGPDGHSITSNSIQHLVSNGLSPEIEEVGPQIIFRRRVQDWASAQWSEGMSSREEAAAAGFCFGRGEGFFEWVFTHDRLRELARASRVRFLAEVSSHSEEIKQTDGYCHPSHYELGLNEVSVHRGLIRDHPHDARGSLSYLRGQPGAYGYLVRASLEGEALQNLARSVAGDGTIRARFMVFGPPRGGLTVYEQDCGRWPVSITLAVDFPA